MVRRAMTKATPTELRRGGVITPALRRVWPPVLVLLGLIAVWQLVGTGSSYASLPTPLLVVKSTWEDRANLWPAAWTTTKEAVLGVLVAIVLRGRARDRDRLVARRPSERLPADGRIRRRSRSSRSRRSSIIWFGFGPRPRSRWSRCSPSSRSRSASSRDSPPPIPTRWTCCGRWARAAAAALRGSGCRARSRSSSPG